MGQRDAVAHAGIRLRRERMRRGMTIDDVAIEAGVSRSMVNRMELGRALQTPIGSWVRVAAALGLELLAPAPAEPQWGIAQVAALASVGGWERASAALEASTLRLGRPPRLLRGCFKPRMAPGELAVLDVIDVLTDLPSAADELAAAVREAELVAPDGWSVSGCLIVRRTSANQRRVTYSERLVRKVRPDSGSAWISALYDPEVRMPVLRSMVWMDSRATRLIPTGLRLRRAG